MLSQCWGSVGDAGPALRRHWGAVRASKLYNIAVNKFPGFLYTYRSTALAELTTCAQHTWRNRKSARERERKRARSPLADDACQDEKYPGPN